jgi:predicted ATPase
MLEHYPKNFWEAPLEIFQLLRDAAQEHLAEALERHGGINAILTRRKLNALSRLKIKLKIDAEDISRPEPMVYTFELSPHGTSYAIPFEQLEWKRDPTAEQPFYYIQVNYQGVRYRTPETTGWAHPTWDYKETELALAQVPRMYTEPEALRNVLTKIRFYSFLDVGYRSVIRLPQPLTPTFSPGPNGENLYSALYNLRTQYRDVYQRIKDILQLAFPDFDDLDFPLVGAGQATMSWYEHGLATPLFPGELSEGTLRFLWLITVLLSPNPAPITLIDEPEVSLHPELLSNSRYAVDLPKSR